MTHSSLTIKLLDTLRRRVFLLHTLSAWQSRPLFSGLYIAPLEQDKEVSQCAVAEMVPSGIVWTMGSADPSSMLYQDQRLG